MKLQNALLVALTSGVLALNSYAAEPEKAATPEATQAKDHSKKMKKHSHMEEKTGVPASAEKGAPAADDKADKDTSKHYHPRDGK